MNMLCSDKTGTLTMNKMVIQVRMADCCEKAAAAMVYLMCASCTQRALLAIEAQVGYDHGRPAVPCLPAGPLPNLQKW